MDEATDARRMPVNTEKIRELRIALKLNQTQAAKRAGLKSAQHWSEIERGDRKTITVTMLERVAKALGVTAAELLK